MINLDDLEKYKNLKGVKIKHKRVDKGKLWHFGISTDGYLVKIIPENVVLDIVVK